MCIRWGRGVTASSRSARDLNILFSFYASKNDVTEHMPLGSILRTGGRREMGEESEPSREKIYKQKCVCVYIQTIKNIAEGLSQW